MHGQLFPRDTEQSDITVPGVVSRHRRRQYWARTSNIDVKPKPLKSSVS